MSSLFQEKKTTFFLFLTLLFIVLAVLYYFFLRPLMTELKTAENNLSSLKSDIENLQQQLNGNLDADSMHTFNLEKKVPLERELRELLLSIQEIELVSGSRIESIEFTYDRKTEMKDTEEKKEEKQDDKEASEAKEETKKINLPEQLKPVTAQLIVISPDYDHFMQFIKEIEQLERITFVEKLEFVKPAEAEILFSEQFNRTIVFTLQLTTFYYDEESD